MYLTEPANPTKLALTRTNHRTVNITVYFDDVNESCYEMSKLKSA